MSILWTLRKWVDAVRHREDQEDLRRQREDWPGETVEGDEKLPTYKPHQEPVAYYVCRICTHQGPDEAYCPKCLAYTMDAVRP